MALLVLAEVDERPGATGLARVALEQAIEHARLGGWGSLEGEIWSLSAVVLRDPAHLDRAEALDRSAVGRVQRRLRSSLLAAERGDLASARQDPADAEQEMKRLLLGPESEAAYWYGRAAQAIALRSGELLPFPARQTRS